tara:strand:+ start:37 stop:549 length:513 start_codon:yes stop_codon:yes gene_type:complete
MVTYFLYRLTNSLTRDKCGATIQWDKRCKDNRVTHGDQCIITELETMEGPDTPEMWQVVGDREWELADQYRYLRGEHYRIAREKRPNGMSKESSRKAQTTKVINNTIGNGGKIGGKKPSRWLRSLTFQQAQDIRSKYIPLKYHMGMLAKEYNITKTTVFHIIHNKIYTQA